MRYQSFVMGKRSAYTAGFKLKVISYAQQFGNRAAGLEYDVNEKLVRGWRKQQEQLRNTSANRKAFRGAKHGKFPEIDAGVLGYVREMRNNGCAISYDMVQAKARQIAREMKIDNKQFKASIGWVVRFMRRHNLSMRRRTSVCQKLPADYTDKVLNFHKFLIQKRQKTAYLLSQIGNADQTPVFFDMPRNSTIDDKGASSVRVKTTGNEKLRCTAMLAITADGRKLPPYVIIKRKTLPKGKFPRGVHVRVQNKGWMDEALMKDWVKCVWNNRPGALLKQPAMLVLDSFRGHLVQPVKTAIEEGKTELVIIPGGLTSVLQPLDVAINKPFKDHLRRLYGEWIASADRELTPTGKVKRPSPEQVCEWIATSWSLISSEMIVKSFRKTGISNALNGTEDEDLWQSDGNNSDHSSDGHDGVDTDSSDSLDNDDL